MEISTLLIASLVLYFVRFPFIVFLIYFDIVFISVDIVNLLVKNPENLAIYCKTLSLFIGFSLNALGFVLYRKNQVGFGFWSYLFGMILFSGGTSLCFNTETEWGPFLYFLIHVGFLFISGFFHRKIFTFFGSLGIISYLGHLVLVFYDSPFLPYMLGALGFGIIMLAAFLLYMKKDPCKDMENSPS
jgi:hypothetical protein